MTRRRAEAALVFCVIVWGLSIPAIKAALEYASPLLAVGVRFGAAGLLLAPALIGATRRELRAGLVIGLLFGVGVALQNTGLYFTTASRSGFIITLSALLTPAIGALALRERPSRGILVRLVAALAGVWLLTAPGGSAGLNVGDLLTLGAAVFFAGQIVAVGYFTHGSRPARVLALKFAVTALIGFAGTATLETSRFDPALALILLLTFLGGGAIVTFTLQLRSQRVLSANEAALIFLLEPVIAAAVGYWAFGERLGPVQVAGGLAIMAAVGWPREKEPRNSGVR